MQPDLMRRYFFGWFGMLLLALLNGAFRGIALTPLFGDLHGHQLSSLILVGLFVLYFRYLLRRYRIISSSEAWVVGAMWFAMTVVFEFGFGRFVAGNSWERLLQDYNILKGRVWSLVLVAIFVGPYVISRRARRLNSESHGPDNSPAIPF